jgi:hypothetical protein
MGLFDGKEKFRGAKCRKHFPANDGLAFRKIP